MAKLEAEAMLLGIWKNFQELEENISMEELEKIVSASREQEHRRNKFLAALKGVDIDGPSNDDIRDRFESVKRKADAEISGKNVEEVEYEDLGIDIETD